MTTNARRSVGHAANCNNLLGGPIDHMPRLLIESYALRYQVYCRERKFLAAENYPNRLERDEFDLHSIHTGVVDMQGVLCGTARIVKPSELGLPLLRHCEMFPHEAEFAGRDSRVIEVGRLAVSRSYRRPGGNLDAAGMRRRGREEVLLTLLKALYQQTKRLGATHWLAATEGSLPRLLSQHGFPCRAIGPEAEYFGAVTPYAMDLKEFDDVILSRRFPVLDQFLIGLEPEFSPRPDQAGDEFRLASTGGGSAYASGPPLGSASHGC
jgi:N-acyl amino acid synthase of PEP-CTERM/exosortase system